jgi:hypothetical protein
MCHAQVPSTPQIDRRALRDRSQNEIVCKNHIARIEIPTPEGSRECVDKGRKRFSARQRF